MSMLLPKGKKRKRSQRKDAVLRDRAYLDWLRTQRCIITGTAPSEYEAVDPMHIGTRGQSVKSPDNEALPVLHRLHARGHDGGEITMLRYNAPDWLIREAFRAYAREFYAKYLSEHRNKG